MTSERNYTIPGGHTGCSCPARLVSSLERPGGPSPRIHRVLRKATRPENLRIDLQEMGMLCYGAGSRPSFRSTMGNDYRALLRFVLFMIACFDSFVVVNAVCPTCKGFVIGCDGSACIMKAALEGNNVCFDATTPAVLGSSIPNLAPFLPAWLSSAFTRPVLECLMAIVTAPVPGSSVDLSVAPYKDSPSMIVQAAAFGHCLMPDALLALNTLLQDAENDLAALKVRGAIDLLKTKVDTVTLVPGQGAYTFIWSKLGGVFTTPATAMAKLVTSVRGSASDMSVSLKRPSCISDFYEMLHWFGVIVASLGIVHQCGVASFYRTWFFLRSAC